MKKWRICVAYQAIHVVEVQAATEELAREKAFANAHASLCWHCSRELTLSEPLEIIDIEEIEGNK